MFSVNGKKWSWSHADTVSGILHFDNLPVLDPPLTAMLVIEKNGIEIMRWNDLEISDDGYASFYISAVQSQADFPVGTYKWNVSVHNDVVNETTDGGTISVLETTVTPLPSEIIDGTVLIDDVPITVEVIGEVTNVYFEGAQGPVPWGNVVNKPDYFPADFNSTVDNIPTFFPSTWTQVASKPTTFAPAAHLHNKADIQDVDPVQWAGTLYMVSSNPLQLLNLTTTEVTTPASITINGVTFPQPSEANPSMLPTAFLVRSNHDETVDTPATYSCVGVPVAFVPTSALAQTMSNVYTFCLFLVRPE